MAIFKCKMCGGDLEIAAGESVAECQYCGSKQTLPRFDSERKANLYDRANHFRRNNEFDKAEGIYEQILNEDLTDAEAYWSLVLCRYGIEYVEDPATHKRVPTVNRAQYTSVFADENYKKAIENAADTLQRELYEAEAKAIDEIQRGILEISEKEDPFDVFICYKETDAQGRRTPDSVLANELYHELTNEGFKVFFSRITLEDKLGTAYEPYIFAALHSAKVMVVLGTKPEYFNAVWVKNEWSRYLALIRGGEKKTLIPAYRDMDPYDLPEEFSHLQAQDMSKLGFMPDLVRGIRKIVEAEKPKEAVKETVVIQQSAGGTNLSAQLKRGMIALEDHDWSAADSFFDKALDMDPESAEAYFGKALAAAQCESGTAFVQKRITQARPNKETLTACDKDTTCVEDAVTRYEIPEYLSAAAVKKCFTYDERTFTSYTAGWETCIANEKTYWEQTDRNLSRALRYAKGETAEQYLALRDKVISTMEEKLANNRAADENERARLTRLYAEEMEKASKKAAELHEEAEKRREADYESCCRDQDNAATWAEFEKAAMSFERDGMRGYKDSDERAARCQAEADRLKTEEKAESERQAAEKRAAAEAKAKAEAEEAERQRIAEEKAAAAAKKKKKTIGIIAAATAMIVISAAIVTTKLLIPSSRYKSAEAFFLAGDYDRAILEFEALRDYSDSETKTLDAKYEKAKKLEADGNYIEAISLLKGNGSHKDSVELLEKCYIGKYGEEKYNQIMESKVGDILTFGNYEQDTSLTGKEEIEWIILDKDGMSFFVISKYILDCKPYNSQSAYVTWETCSLRTWLNGSFFNTAFNADEQTMIPTVTVSEEKNPKFNTSPGNTTQDKVFLLSTTEVLAIFDVQEKRDCPVTDYARSHRDSYTNTGNYAFSWWLRTPGVFGDRASVVEKHPALSSGSIGNFDVEHTLAVRPAMWIDYS